MKRAFIGLVVVLALADSPAAVGSGTSSGRPTPRPGGRRPVVTHHYDTVHEHQPNFFHRLFGMAGPRVARKVWRGASLGLIPVDVPGFEVPTRDGGKRFMPGVAGSKLPHNVLFWGCQMDHSNIMGTLESGLPQRGDVNEPVDVGNHVLRTGTAARGVTPSFRVAMKFSGDLDGGDDIHGAIFVLDPTVRGHLRYLDVADSGTYAVQAYRASVAGVSGYDRESEQEIVRIARFEGREFVGVIPTTSRYSRVSNRLIAVDLGAFVPNPGYGGILEMTDLPPEVQRQMK